MHLDGLVPRNAKHGTCRWGVWVAQQSSKLLDRVRVPVPVLGEASCRQQVARTMGHRNPDASPLAFVAQGTEQPFRNRPVRGSNPRGGSPALWRNE